MRAKRIQAVCSEGGRAEAAAHRVVCFGVITPAITLIVDELPAWNAGAAWTTRSEYVSHDAAIVAGLLAEWGMDTNLVGSALGDDEGGRKTVAKLKGMGVKGNFIIRQDIESPLEVAISDAAGGRTYFWNRSPKLLATLDDADLSSLRGASMLYVDWYDAPHIERAMRQARRLGVPVFLNLEHGHQDADMLKSLAPYASVCQATTDESQLGDDGERVARMLIECGVAMALVTMAAKGAVGMQDGAAVHVEAPGVDIKNTTGAGATFSAAFIRSHLLGNAFEQSIRLAVAAASLKCTDADMKAFPDREVNSLAATLTAKSLPT